MEPAVDILDMSLLDIYKNNILTALKWMTSIWKEVSQKTYTKLLADDCNSERMRKESTRQWERIFKGG